jgi:hypothetical protein
MDDDARESSSPSASLARPAAGSSSPLSLFSLPRAGADFDLEAEDLLRARSLWAAWPTDGGGRSRGGDGELVVELYRTPAALSLLAGGNCPYRCAKGLR